MLKKCQLLFYSLQRLCISNKKSCVALFFLLYIICAASLANLRVLTSIDDLIDTNFESYSALESLKEDFVARNNLTLFISKSDLGNYTKKDFCKISEHLRSIKMNFEGLDFILTSRDLKKLTLKNNNIRFEPYFDINCHIKSDYDKDLTPIYKTIQSNSPWHDIVTSKKSHDFMVSFYFLKSNGQNGELSIPDVETLKTSWDSFEVQHPEFKLSWIGDGAFQYYLRKGYDKMLVLNLLVMLFILFLFKFFWGTYKSGFIYIVSISITSTIVLGGMVLTDCPMDVLSNAISLMLFVSSIEDFIFLSYLRSKTEHWKLPFKKILIPSFLTSFTTFIGFGSLYFTDLEIIRRFGVWAAVGALVEWLVMFYFTPAMMELFPKLQNWVKPGPSSSKLNKLSIFNSFKLPRAAALILLITIPICFFGLDKITVEDSPQSIFPKDHPGQKDLQYVFESRGWRAHISLIFKDQNKITFNKNVIESYRKQNFVKAIDSPYDIEDHLSNKLKAKGLEGYVLDGWKESLFGKKYYSQNDDKIRTLLYLDNLDITQTLKIIEYNKSLCPNEECFLAGSLISYAEFGTRILNSLFKSFALSLLLVSLVIAFLCWQFKTNDSPPLIVASLWGPISLIALFYIFNFSITYVTSLIASIMVGLAGDNAIQFIYRKKSMYENASFYENCSLFVSVCMIFISCSFFMSDFIQIQKLGLFMVVGFILNYIGDVFILKALTKSKI